MNQQKIAVAMSGGVDSAVVAALLKKQGYQVRGIFMALAQPDLRSQINRVQEIGRYLDIQVEIIDLSKAFQQNVLDYFTDSYINGKTPNPCIVCNQFIKCGQLLNHLDNQSDEMLATGHYARIIHDPIEGYQLYKGCDSLKDQSYFLCRLTQQQLAQLSFPLGELTKKAVYRLAADFGLESKHSLESQDICFRQHTIIDQFLAGRYKKKSGKGLIVTASGAKVGEHQGIHQYTIGQRRGLGVADSTPYYVVALDAQQHLVIVGKEDDLWQKQLIIRQPHWINHIIPALPRHFEVKIRYRHKEDPALVSYADDNSIMVKFKTAQRAITPGQFVVFYDKQRLVGSGEISQTFI